MDDDMDEHRDYPEANLIVNDDLAHPFSSPIDTQPIHRSFNDLSIEYTKSIEKDLQSEEKKPFEEYLFENQQSITNIEENLLWTKTDQIDFDQTLKSLQIQCDKVQRITPFLQNQLIDVKTMGEKLSLFCADCRSELISTLNLHQKTDDLSTYQLEMLTIYTPEFDPILSKTFLEKDHLNEYSNRLKYARSILIIVKQAKKLQNQISSLNDLLVKSVLSKNERFNEIEQCVNLPSKFFNSFEQIFTYETTKENVYIRSLGNQLKENDFHIISIDHWKHPLAQINYDLAEKASYIFDIQLTRVITSIDQLILAIPCFQFTSNTRQQIFIRCKRLMDPLIYIPARIEFFNHLPYAIFRITHALSDISVEAILFYPFQSLQTSINESSSVYTSVHSSIFRIETAKNYFTRPPRVRLIPLNADLIHCLNGLKSEDQLLSSSDLIEFQWFKENKSEGIISITIPFTRHFDSLQQTNEDLRQRRRKGQKKMSSQRQKFEQEKYDESGGSLGVTPTSTDPLISPTVISHLPSIASIVERVRTDHSNELTERKLNWNREKSSPSTFQWKLDSFENNNAPIILLGYKNRRWKSINHLVTIIPTDNKEILTVNLTILFDRLLLIRCWPESNHESKFDHFADHLWSLSSKKFFSCVLARDPSSFDTGIHYALIIVSLEKENLAEEILRKRNYTESIFQHPLIEEKNSESELMKINPYQSQHTLSFHQSFTTISKYHQFCLHEGTYITILPKGNIDLHEKVELSVRLHSHWPIVLEFDIYPIDIYRQKTDEDFIGTLQIYQINEQMITLPSTNSTMSTAAAVSSRTSSGSKDTEMSDGVPMNSSPRTSSSGPETISHAGTTFTRSAFERIHTRDLKESNLICQIDIRLPKATFHLPSPQFNPIPFDIPHFFTEMLDSFDEGKREFAQALNIHPSLISSTISQQRDNFTQSNTSFNHLSKDIRSKTKENESLFKWFKRQNVFQMNQLIEKIIAALIQIGRVDLAYIFQVNHLTRQCSNL